MRAQLSYDIADYHKVVNKALNIYNNYLALHFKIFQLQHAMNLMQGFTDHGRKA